ncbi:MAG: hypothetical protein RLZZ292_2116 [Bacteroidota bacterium]
MQKTILLYIPFLFLLPTIQAQDFAALDKYAQNAPDDAAKSIPVLANYLGKKADTELEKVRGAFAWMAFHVEYDHDVIDLKLLATSQNTAWQKAEMVLKRRTGVCEGYANLFKALCNVWKIDCYFVTGLVKQGDGSVPDTPHAWNSVKIDDEWHLLDVTWGATPSQTTNTIDERYFLTDATIFIKNHYPDDPMWQLSDYPISETEFRENSSIPSKSSNKTKKTTLFYFQDSITNTLRLSEAQQEIVAARRTIQYSGENERALINLAMGYFKKADVTYRKADYLFEKNRDAKTATSEGIALLRLQLDTIEKQVSLGNRYLRRIQASNHLIEAGFYDKLKQVYESLSSIYMSKTGVCILEASHLMTSQTGLVWAKNTMSNLQKRFADARLNIRLAREFAQKDSLKYEHYEYEKSFNHLNNSILYLEGMSYISFVQNGMDIKNTALSPILLTQYLDSATQKLNLLPNRQIELRLDTIRDFMAHLPLMKYDKFLGLAHANTLRFDIAFHALTEAKGTAPHLSIATPTLNATQATFQPLVELSQQTEQYIEKITLLEDQKSVKINHATNRSDLYYLWGICDYNHAVRVLNKNNRPPLAPNIKTFLEKTLNNSIKHYQMSLQYLNQLPSDRQAEAAPRIKNSQKEIAATKVFLEKIDN